MRFRTGVTGSNSGSSNPRSITAQTKSNRGLWVAYLFFGVFALAGGAMGYYFFVKPILRIIESQNWTESRCTVVSSAVGSHSDSDGATYSVDIVFRYSFAGREETSNRYNFMPGSSSGYERKKKIVDRYQPGSTAPCFINPSDPQEAVLSREYPLELLFGLIPLLFFLVGFGGIYGIWRSSQRDGRNVDSLNISGMGGAVRDDDVYGAIGISQTHYSTGNPVKLKATSSSLARFIGILVFSLFWNGIVGVFVFETFESWATGRVDYMNLLFLTPFVLVGLVLLSAVVYYFLAIFNPRLEVTVSSQSVKLGDKLQIQWAVLGKAERISKFKVYLQGKEEARYSRGTSTYTATEVFSTIEVFNSSMPTGFMRGECTANLPIDTIHSFNSDNNKILWTLVLHGEIAKWPDLKEEFPLTVLPGQG